MEKIFNFKNTYTELPKEYFKKTTPSKVENPNLIIYNNTLATELGLKENINEETLVNLLSGKEIEEGSTPIAQAYAGHQFGHFTMLGDGRAILLGEYTTKKGETLDIQLKGAGRTFYSRGGDGKAALGPMLREYIISEGMHGLKIKTTRSLAVVETGEVVYRENEQRGAVLTRISKSHLRVGTFQYARALDDKVTLKALADYTINRHYKECENSDNPYLEFLRSVIKAQAELVSSWSLAGFIHGVMNTDNITISGETIDYGPCAFMDVYNGDTVFSSIDTYGRYSYKNQPNILGWNLARFAETLLPLIHEDSDKGLDLVNSEIKAYPELYMELWVDGMRGKLGLFTKEKEDKNLIDMLLTIMSRSKLDYTNTFRHLTLGDYENLDEFKGEEFKAWLTLWKERLSRENRKALEIKELMMASNPFVIPRNHKVEEGIRSAVEFNDLEPLHKLLEILKNPYDYSRVVDESYLSGGADKNYRTYCGT